MVLLGEQPERVKDRVESLGIEFSDEMFVFSGTKTPDHSVPYSPNAVTQRYKDMAARVGVKTHLHALRHHIHTEHLSVLRGRIALRDRAALGAAVRGVRRRRGRDRPADKLTDAAPVAFTEAAQRNTPPVHERPQTTRRTFMDHLEVARRAWTPDVEVTPSWVREVTSCSRGLSSRIAAALAEEMRSERAHRERRTGLRRGASRRIPISGRRGASSWSLHQQVVYLHIECGR